MNRGWSEVCTRYYGDTGNIQRYYNGRGTFVGMIEYDDYNGYVAHRVYARSLVVLGRFSTREAAQEAVEKKVRG